MATAPPAQRTWRAACPNCGAAVEFASAASISAVCSFCRSTLLRDGESLRRIGVSAELFDDHSLLQLGVSGRHQGLAFTLVGRLQYRYEGGTWNEWHASFDNGKSGWLSEDNGAYVFAFDAVPTGALPRIEELSVGQRCLADGRAWDVASLNEVTLAAAEGELPQVPRLGQAFKLADLRGALGEVATLDFGQTAGNEPGPGWAVGTSVALLMLNLKGLREASEKTLSGRSLNCPNCGNALVPSLSTTQAIVCGQCQALVDISQDAGADLAHVAQNNSGAAGLEPQLRLGRSGRLALGAGEPLPWQVVGYLERCNLPAGVEDDTEFWREYLLYNATEGFVFLVDAQDGWSWMRPLTGAPEQRGSQAVWLGDTFTRHEGYLAKTTWVLGEFYWRVKVGEVLRVGDFRGIGPARHKRLSREQATNEVTWSLGQTLNAVEVADAFNIPPAERAALQRDAAPVGELFSAGSGSAVGKGVFVFVVLVVLVILLAQCGRDDCDQVRTSFGAASSEYQQCVRSGGGGVRSGGGSFGGFSSGGGHK